MSGPVLDGYEMRLVELQALFNTSVPPLSQGPSGWKGVSYAHKSALHRFHCQHGKKVDWVIHAPILLPFIINPDAYRDGHMTLLKQASQGAGLREVFQALSLPWALRHYRLFDYDYPYARTVLGIEKYYNLGFSRAEEDSQAVLRSVYVRRVLKQLSFSAPIPFKNWLFQQFEVFPAVRDIQYLCDYAFFKADWPKKISFARAMERAADYHARGSGNMGPVDHYDDKTSYLPFGFAPSFSYRGLRFEALQTRRDLAAESAAMHHCVGWDAQNYWRDQAAKRAVFYHLESDWGPATVEIKRRGAEWYMRQIQGRENAHPPQSLSYLLSRSGFIAAARPPAGLESPETQTQTQTQKEV